MITGKDFQDWRFRNAQENEHESVTAARFARHCVEQQQAKIDKLKSSLDELADLVESALPIIDGGGWLARSTELRDAIAKARGDL